MNAVPKPLRHLDEVFDGVKILPRQVDGNFYGVRKSIQQLEGSFDGVLEAVRLLEGVFYAVGNSIQQLEGHFDDVKIGSSSLKAFLTALETRSSTPGEIFRYEKSLFRIGRDISRASKTCFRIG